MRKLIGWTSLLLLVALGPCASAQKQQPSVADAARANRKQNPDSAKTVWTNDNISTVPKTLATEGEAEATQATNPDEAKKDCDKANDPTCQGAKAKPEQKDQASKADDYKKKLAELEKSAADMKREQSLNEREWQLQSSSFYGDAGTRLRDPKKFSDEQANHQKDAERLQKAIEDIQKKIDDLKEQARKDNVKL